MIQPMLWRKFLRILKMRRARRRGGF